MKEGQDNMSEYIKLENSIKEYQKQIEEKEQQLNQINNTQIRLLKERNELKSNYNLNMVERYNTINKLQEERKKVEEILKVVNEEKEKLKEEGNKYFVEYIKHKRQNADYQKELEERKKIGK
jgi:chromosome segregation ATPase